MMQFNEERTYGVEIEVLTKDVTQNMIAEAINYKGVKAYVEGYNHNTKAHWKVITDSSCGFEIVSPVLKGYDGIEQIKKVCEALNAIGCKVDKTCGLHVHHGVTDFDIKNFKTLYAMYAKYEEAIDSIMPISRRKTNAYYCGTMLSPYGYDVTLEKIEACKTLSDLQLRYPSRYKKLNVQSYVRYGTIEFRQHSGTTDSEKIINWIFLTQAMIMKSLTGTIKKESKKKYDEVGYLLHILGMLRKNRCSEEYMNTGRFYMKRMRDFQKKERVNQPVAA